MTPFIVYVILQNMWPCESKTHSFQFLVNYWEIRPTQMKSFFGQLVQKRVSRVVTFIPMQVFESDISHGLLHFLQAASDHKVEVGLIATPDVGIHFPGGGLPKDLMQNKDILAKDELGKSYINRMPPSSFELPSMHSETWKKRYSNFLNRLYGFLENLDKTNPKAFSSARVLITGGFWKYYRSASDCSFEVFTGKVGDQSKNAALSFQKTVQKFYEQKEFIKAGAGFASRWKTQAYDELNQKWFHQQSEQVYRYRTEQILNRRSLEANLQHIELYTPDADPSFSYSYLLQKIANGNADFYQLSRFLDLASSRLSGGTEHEALPWVHWSSLGVFHTLSDVEKQFLILKSLFLFGGRSGSVLLDLEDWLELSDRFRDKVTRLASSLEQGTIKHSSEVLYFNSHLWGNGSAIWHELFRSIQSRAKMVSSLEVMLKQKDSKMIVVDPSVVFTKDKVNRLFDWAEKGRILVLPRSPLFSIEAMEALETRISNCEKMEFNLGVHYQLYSTKNGKVILYDLPEENVEKTELTTSWEKFMRAMLSLSDVEEVCRFSDSRLSAIVLKKAVGEGEGVHLVVMNTTSRPVSADLIFRQPVVVFDAACMEANSKIDPMSRFQIMVPPRGVVPLVVQGLNTDADQRLQAALIAAETRKNIDQIAYDQLAGFDAENNLSEQMSETKWN